MVSFGIKKLPIKMTLLVIRGKLPDVGGLIRMVSLIQ